jgi:D-glycero-D-manno-heptose 1,7-bisphosphate phosphatase
MPRPAVFLDRDGTLIEDAHFLARPEQVWLLPGAVAAVARLNRRGTPVVVVTNQSGVARGLFPEAAVHAVHAHLSRLLAEHGARIDAFYHCPHHPKAAVAAYRLACACRKPRPGMLVAAARDLGLDLARSWMIGDKPDDAGAGAAAGCRAVLVRTGHPLPADVGGVEVVADLAAAVDLLERS